MTRLERLFHHSLAIEVASVDTDLIDEGMMDSLTLVDLLVRLEQEFQIVVSIDDLEIENFRTIRLLASFVAARKEISDTRTA